MENEKPTEDLNFQEPTERIYEAPAPRSSAFSFIFEMIKIALLAFVIILPIRVFLFQPFFVQGASMEPNFEDNEYLIINEFGYKKTKIGFGNTSLLNVESFKEIERQDVAVFHYPKNPSQFFIKRTIGLPGEKIQIKNSQVVIFNDEHPDGFTLDEKGYLSLEVKTAGDLTINLANDEYFVMGDNRMFSSDSRSWGPVTKDQIVGRVLIRAWPVDRWRVY